MSVAATSTDFTSERSVICDWLRVAAVSWPLLMTSSTVDLVLACARHRERVGLHSATWLGRMSRPLYTSSSERFGGAVIVMVVGAEPAQANCADSDVWLNWETQVQVKVR